MPSSSQSSSSSPDPLAASQNNQKSPRAKDEKVLTLRKPLRPTTGNSQAHEFSFMTPKVQKVKHRSPSKSGEPKESGTSPWRVRITVQAEQDGRAERSNVPQCSPSKIFTEKTFTTTIPLKGGDETSPVRRKAKGTPRKGRSSRARSKPKSRSRSRSTSAVSAGSPTKDADSTLSSTPKRGRGRPRKSMESPRSTCAIRKNEKIRENLYPKIPEFDYNPRCSDFDTENRSNEHGHEEAGPFEFGDEHCEFDSVLESEGFSMVSVSSLPSTQTMSASIKDPVNLREGSSPSLPKRQITPTVTERSPGLPPPHIPAAIPQDGRAIDQPTAGTPKLVRVVRAGIALQGVLSPAKRNPGSSQSSSRLNSSSPLSTATSPKERLDELFNGFGPGTRRELRAGLRLGEELARRQAQPGSRHGALLNEDVFAATSEVQYPKIPDGNMASGYTLRIPGATMTASPSFSNNQLPSPARSDVDADDDEMSWKFDTWPQRVAPSTPKDERSAIADIAGGSSFPNEPTMIEREAEWQREREAISKQIQEANASQVIVIDSDDEDDGHGRGDPRDVSPLDEDSEDDGDIWQEEAQNSHTSQSTSDTPPIFRQTEVPKPRRSQLPSPWMRKSRNVSEMTASGDDSELLGVSAKPEEVYEKFKTPIPSSVQELATHTPTPDEVSVSKNLTPRRETNLREDTVGSSNVGNVSDQEDESQESFSDNEDLESHLLSQQSMQDDTTGPLDESTELYSNLTQVSITDVFEEEVAEPQTPSPPAQSPKPKTPKHVRFSEETIRPNGSELSAPESAQLPPAQSSWFSRVTSLLPTWGTTAPTAIPLPSDSKRIVHLAKVDHDPLPMYMPWTQSHWWALIHIVRQSQAGPTAFPYTTNETSSNYLGAVVSVHKWSKKITKQDCAIAERFLEVLRLRGTFKGVEAAAVKGGKRQWGRIPGQLIDLPVIFSAVVSQWACDVQDGVLTVGWGDRAGLKGGSETETWTKADLAVDGASVVYV
ncbi:MAG: hypothetical protein Q9170_004465 [Blastenia crenularia]